jgi:NADPH-dependent 2,4-dienoyl-CoA reductase/sulfur reductase-like enzyme
MQPDHQPPEKIAIVGGSLSGVRTAEALRRLGFVGELTIIGNEPGVPYDRPPLSKGFLAGLRREDQLSIHPTSPNLADLNCEFVPNDPAETVDLASGSLRTEAGRTHTFDSLVAATGTRLRQLPDSILDPGGRPPLVGLRTLEDAKRLQPLLMAGSRVVVVGAGFIGAEVASTASAAGCVVTVIETIPIPLARQVGDQIGGVCAALHARQDVRLLTSTSVERIDSAGVHISSGECLVADVVVVGVGVVPNTEWLQESGLDVSNGVSCHPSLRAVEPPGSSGLKPVVAVGDIARWTNPRYDESARVEHWTNAVETADHAAATLLGSEDPFCPVPYFWSDQYGVKIQCLGRTTGFDEVRIVAGSTEEFKFVALYRRGDRLVAALGMSMVRHVMGYRQMLLDDASWNDAISSLNNE